ncbi:MAG: glutamine-hydrolyzing carbamoyl-phosphate synthase small subunit, partial [Limnobacter sp.]|nr:glutamine-hydrolyzing carbamoyl-phosphate synthase small subunit [Limnobacter sp.]
DTRKLTRILREKGAQAGCLMTENAEGEFSADRAVSLAQDFPGLAGMDLAKVVTCESAHEWVEGEWALGDATEQPHFQQGERPLHVVAYDFGVKRNILRMLAQRGCRVTVVPAQTPASEVLSMNPDGVFLSNGPGDPEPCDYAISAIETILADSKVPVFGICLGHQLLALASGAKTMKMKFGHHGANHPVQTLDGGKVVITSQNHGFAVDPDSLPSNVKVTHVSLFDQSIQGIELADRSAFSFQGHPEASPGPHDLADLFDQFVGNMQAVSA